MVRHYEFSELLCSKESWTLSDRVSKSGERPWFTSPRLSSSFSLQQVLHKLILLCVCFLTRICCCCCFVSHPFSPPHSASSSPVLWYKARQLLDQREQIIGSWDLYSIWSLLHTVSSEAWLISGFIRLKVVVLVLKYLLVQVLQSCSKIWQ